MTQTIDELVRQSRTKFVRLTAMETFEAQKVGALIVDSRTGSQRKKQGDIPGAIVIDRTVLEWRLDPHGQFKIPEAKDHDIRVIVVCRQGYSSSLAAESLRRLGLWRATDLVGGFEAWKEAGLPVFFGPADVRR